MIFSLMRDIPDFSRQEEVDKYLKDIGEYVATLTKYAESNTAIAGVLEYVAVHDYGLPI